MSYYKELQLTREPFSNSPDPDFFYRTQDRVECLSLMEVHIRLKRGLCVLLGEVGTGKTTLCRQLLIEMQGDDMLESYLLLDPQFRSAKEFLGVLYRMIVGSEDADLSEWQMKEALKNALFDLSVNKGKTIVLLIDEGQKLRHDGIELLRELLNYETNSSKLLQIVIFAQNEFKEALHSYANFADRISTILYIGPFVFRETVEMIKFRIRETQSGETDVQLFTFRALRAIHKASGGYPRKIVILCHKALLQIIMENKSKVSSKTVKKILGKEQPAHKRIQYYYYAAAVLLIFVVTVYLLDGFSSKALLESPSVASVAPTQDVPATQQKAEEEDSPLITQVKQSTVSIQPPEMLGEVQLKENVPLGELLKRIYGADRESFRRIFLGSNPGLDKSETVHAGVNVHFPLILQTPGSAFTGMFWLELASYQTLQEACAALHEQEKNGYQTAMLASFTASKGVRFSIVIKEVFASENAALDMLESLPPSVRVHSKIVRNWGESAILYTIPEAWPHDAAKSAQVNKKFKNAS